MSTNENRKLEKFKETIQNGYSVEGKSFMLGAAMYEGEAITESFVRLPLKTFNRHGLIAGATGTGKTKTLQMIAEQLSANGVPCLLMDIKGDLSGVAVAGVSTPGIEKRHERIGFPFIPGESPVEFLTLSNEKGSRLRATVSEFGPVLFSKLLDLNDTQRGILSLVFKYCDDHSLPLVDIRDVRKVMRYITNEGKDELSLEYGSISTSSIGAISRRLIELEQQGADLFFGELSFDVEDLLRHDEWGRGVLSILRLTDIQDKPGLFSTFMLQLLAEIYSTFPEMGDMDKPKLCIFIDEAHLVFKNASKALLDQLEMVVKLIRSKGVGIFFITQNPTDIPDGVLSQLGMKIQHALRAFTAKDRRAIKSAAENFPISEYYKTDQLLTELGIGEALVTALSERGIPTPLVHCYLRAPHSRMDVLTDEEIDHIIQKSALVRKYTERVDIETAYDILAGKIEVAREEEIRRKNEAEMQKLPPRQTSTTRQTNTSRRKSPLDTVINSPTSRSIGNTVAREVTRGLLGMLGVPTSTRKRSTRRRSSWF
jgi:hypothetical protein